MSPLSPISSVPPPADPRLPQKFSQEQQKKIRSQKVTMDQPPTEKTALDPPHENQNMSTRQSQMNELPEIREDRITQIQHSLENGTYAVSAEQLAEKIIREL